MLASFWYHVLRYLAADEQMIVSWCCERVRTPNDVIIHTKYSSVSDWLKSHA